MNNFVVIDTFKGIQEAFSQDSLHYRYIGSSTTYKVKNLDDFVLGTNILFLRLDEELNQGDRVMIDNDEYVLVITKQAQGILLNVKSFNRWSDPFRMPGNMISLAKLREICNHHNSPEDQVTVEKMK